MGRKRVRLDSKFESDKCAKIIYGENDRISHLPDEILVHILSSLSLKEAVSTSFLSSRWLNLWKNISCINLDAESSLDKITERYKLRHGDNRKWEKWVKWVTFCLGSNKAATLKAFKIYSDLSQSDEMMITEWLKFALRRKVQILELDLPPIYKNRRNPSADYAFPKDFLTHNNPSIDFKSLKSLSLKFVNVTDEAIHFFLRNCPLLENLFVDRAPNLSDLEFCGTSLLLKHLELKRCYSLNSVKVSLPNLTSLTLPNVDGLLLENVPMLAEVSVGYMYPSVKAMKKLLPALSCCLFQLEILSLPLLSNSETSVVLSDFPVLPKLKKLTIKYRGEGESLMELTPLLTKSPCLEEFVLELIWWRSSGIDGEVKSTMKFPLRHLKVFKFCGYYGHERVGDDELVRYVLENSAVLEKVIIGPLYRLSFKKMRVVDDCLKQQIEAQVPEGVELVVL